MYVVSLVAACDLVSWPGSNPPPLHWEHWVLATGPRGNPSLLWTTWEMLLLVFFSDRALPIFAGEKIWVLIELCLITSASSNLIHRLDWTTQRPVAAPLLPALPPFYPCCSGFPSHSRTSPGLLFLIQQPLLSAVSLSVVLVTHSQSNLENIKWKVTGINNSEVFKLHTFWATRWYPAVSCLESNSASVQGSLVSSPLVIRSIVMVLQCLHSSKLALLDPGLACPYYT